MEEKLNEDEVLLAIDNIKTMLDSQHLAAKKIMALRDPSRENLRSTVGNINATHDELICAIGKLKVPEIALSLGAAAIKNKEEFEARQSEFLQRGILSPLPGEGTWKLPSVDGCSQKSCSSSRSRFSTQSIELKEAEAELRVAEICVNSRKKKPMNPLFLLNVKQKNQQCCNKQCNEKFNSSWRLQEPYMKYGMKTVILQAKPSLKFQQRFQVFLYKNNPLFSLLSA